MNASLLARVLDRMVAIQQIPAPTFQEQQRAAFVAEQFRVEELQDVSIDDLGTVYGRLPGSNEKRPLVVSAHTDTVFPLGTDLQVKREAQKVSGPGIGDNSLGVAGLFGLLWALRQNKISLPGDLWLVANVAEEGLGNLTGMRAVVERFGDRPLAYVVLEGMALGQIYHCGLGVRRYTIRVQTRGGHSWVDYGRPSAVHELAALVNHLVGLPVPSRPRSSLNVGVIRGGISVNTIAASAQLELDLRSESTASLDYLSRQVEGLVSQANRNGILVEAAIVGERPPGQIAITHPLVRLAERCLQAQGLKPNLGLGSTDANIPLSLGLPAICIGMTNGSGAHTLDEFIYTRPLQQGLGQLLALVEGAYQALE